MLCRIGGDGPQAFEGGRLRFRGLRGDQLSHTGIVDEPLNFGESDRDGWSEYPGQLSRNAGGARLSHMNQRLPKRKVGVRRDGDQGDRDQDRRQQRGSEANRAERQAITSDLGHRRDFA